MELVCVGVCVLQVTTFSLCPLKPTLQSRGRSSCHSSWDQPPPLWSSSLQLWSSLSSASGQNTPPLSASRKVRERMKDEHEQPEWRQNTSTLTHLLLPGPTECIQTARTCRNICGKYFSFELKKKIEIASNVNFVCMSSKPPQNSLSGLLCHL